MDYIHQALVVVFITIEQSSLFNNINLDCIFNSEPLFVLIANSIFYLFIKLFIKH